MVNIKRLLNKLPNEYGYLIENPVNIRYLTGSNIDTAVLLLVENQPYFITDFRYIETAESYFKNSSVNVIEYSKLRDTISQLLNKHKISNLYLETDYQTLSKLKFYKDCCENLKYDNILDVALEELRAVKLPFEIEYIKQAQQITDAAFEHILNYIKVGVKERDIALELEMFMRQNGAESTSFDIIAVSGKNSSLPHGVPSEKVIEKGEFLTLDFGCKVGGYCSDMTRTVAIGYIDSEMERVYNTVLQAQKAALNKIKAGVACCEVDKTARDIIYNAGYEGCFGHSTGHGVGLYIHENPRLNSTNKLPLKSSMVVTVEPGIYIKGKFGVRIEDLVVVTNESCENLTKSPKELIVL